MRTPGFGVRRGSSTSGVLPTSSRSELATTGHRRQENHRRALAHRRLEAVARAHVLAFDVDVHEARELAVVEDARAESRKLRHQVVEQLAHGRALGEHLALAAGLLAQ